MINDYLINYLNSKVLGAKTNLASEMVIPIGTVEAIIKHLKGKCTHDPKQIKGPIGMYHCPECGEMVLAGMEHPILD